MVITPQQVFVRSTRSFFLAMGMTSLLVLSTGCFWMPPAAVTRADLGTSLQRFEQCYAANPPAGAKTAAVSRAFDEATTAFFLGNYGEVIKGIEGAAAMLRSTAPNDLQRVATSLKARISPSAFSIGSATVPTIRLTSMYEVSRDAEGRFELKLCIRDESGGLVHQQLIEAMAGPSARIDVSANLQLDPAMLSIQNYSVELVADGLVLPLLKWPVVRRPLAAAREENAGRLAQFTAETPELRQALASVIARNALLLDPPGEDRVIEFVSNRSELEIDVAMELDKLEAGENPFLRRAGDYWRVFKREGDEIPLRVYCPPSLDLTRPVPLVVAFHGYGGDENLFPDAYGAGVIKKLADQHGFLLVCPLTYPFLNSPMVFDRLLEVIGYDYPIDLARVYVMGHSLGAVAAASIAPKRADRVAAACLFAAGSNLAEAGTLPPTIVFLGGVDLISPAERSRPGIQMAIEKGLPIELREKPELGHTILVSEALPEGAAFLMGRRHGSVRDK